jgi:hypothetical protein
MMRKSSNTRHSEYIRARKGGVIKVSESPSVVPILKNLYIDPEKFLGNIKKVEVRNV